MRRYGFSFLHSILIDRGLLLGMVPHDGTRAQGAGFQVHLSKLLSTIAGVVGRTGNRIELVKCFFASGLRALMGPRAFSTWSQMRILTTYFTLG